MTRLIAFILFALLFLQPAAARADYAEGLQAYTRHEWQKAIALLRPLAEAGDDRAQILIGNMYNEGWGVLISHSEAYRLYRRAAGKDNAEAATLLGAMTLHGQGIPASRSAALAWFLRAAQLGDQNGSFFAGTMLAMGNESSRDHAPPNALEAYKWFRICAAQKGTPQMAAVCTRMADGLARKSLPREKAAGADAEARAFKPADPAKLGPLPDVKESPKAAPPAAQGKPSPAAPKK